MANDANVFDYQIGPPALPKAAPADDRLGHVDFLRGIALLAILVMNIQSFSMPLSAMFSPTDFGTQTSLDYGIWLAGHVLVFTKAMAVFTMLFGAGIVMQSDRVTASGRSSTGLFYRRMGILAAIGFLHAYLLWYGDILFMYAAIGSLAYLLRRLRPAWLIAIGASLQLVCPLLYGGLGALAMSIPSVADAMQDAMAIAPDDVQAEIDAYRGGYLQQMPQRAIEAVMMQGLVLPFNALPTNGGLMLIGMVLWKLRFFAAESSSKLHVSVASAGLAIGFTLSALDVYAIHRIEEGAAALYQSTAGMALVQLSSPFLAIGYLSLFTLLYRALPGAVAHPFVSAGRMALSGYLLTTLICTTIYYGHGFGAFMHHTRTQQFTVVLGVWAFLLIFSTMWLRAFRFGPFEWLWRSATYGTWQPLRRRDVSA